jgi:transcriptional regulator with XRE-family HTH domain
MEDNKPFSPPGIASSQEGAAPMVRLEDLSELIRTKRKAENLTLEQAAKQSNVSAATLSRLERQQSKDKPASTPDMRTIEALARWLGVARERIIDVDDEFSSKSATKKEQENKPVPDIVEAHLRADRKLNPVHAEALATMFRAVYQKYAEADDDENDE